MNFYEVIFIFAHIWFEIRIFSRILESMKHKFVLSKASLTKIGTAFVLYLVFVVNFSTLNHFFMQVFLIHTPTIALFSFGKLKEWYAKKVFQEGFCCFLSNILLFMQSGCSFRESFQKANHINNKTLQLKMDQILKFVVFSQHNEMLSTDRFAKSMAMELKNIDASQHQVRSRIENLRDELQAESDFRRKSGQILRQARLQALLVAVMYIALGIFMVCSFGWNYVQPYVLSSFILLACGVVWLFRLGRRIKWKV